MVRFHVYTALYNILVPNKFIPLRYARGFNDVRVYDPLI
jgi:hypothetical protein